MSDATTETPIPRGPSWKEKLAAFIERVRMRVTSNPLLMVGLALMAISAFTYIGGSMHASMRDHATSTPIMAVKEGTLNDISQALKDGNLSSITKHTVYKNASIVDPRVNDVSIFKMKDDSELRLSSSVLPEEFWKRITEASDTQSFLITDGEMLPQPSRLISIAGLMFIYSTIIMVLLFAQMVVGEVVSGHSFSADQRDRSIRLSDVIGYPEVKREVVEIIDKIKNAHKYAGQNIKAPRGLLFLGDPGVGKTMLAKAMANEMGAKFFYCTGADFAEMYVGVGPRRVRTLFKRARKHPRSFIFIDEIDAIGSRNSMGNDSERQGVINQFLAEMDGMNSNGTLILVGATNHANLLDPALRRPGRFDKEIHIPLPDAETRKGILEKYLSGFKLSDNVDLEAIASRTQGYSGAMLSGLVEETKNLALRQAGGSEIVISQETIELAQEVGMLGVSSAKAHPDDIDRVAVHELGHALAGLMRCPHMYIEKVTIAGRGRALGYASMRPLHERALRTEASMRGDLIMKLSGRAAEQVVLGDVSSGAMDDLERATELARDMVSRMGMGKRTGLMVAARSPDPTAMPDTVREDVGDLLRELYQEAVNLVSEHREWLEGHRATFMTGGVETLTHDALQEGLQLPK